MTNADYYRELAEDCLFAARQSSDKDVRDACMKDAAALRCPRQTDRWSEQTSHNAIAAKLNERNVRTARGGKKTHVQVGAILHPFVASAGA